MTFGFRCALLLLLANCDTLFCFQHPTLVVKQCQDTHLASAFACPVQSRINLAACITKCTLRKAKTSVTMAKNLPRNVKDTIDQLRQSMQEGLRGRCSRMDIELPYAVNLGVERAQTKGSQPLMTAEDAKTSDRELARIVLEMFQGTGLSVAVAFADSQQAQKASKKWSGSFSGQIIVLDEKLKKKSPSTKAFGKGADAPQKSAIPDGIEVVIMVAPQPKHLDAIEKIAREKGLDFLMILVNARLDEQQYISDAQREFFQGEFERIYLLRPNPLPSWNGAVLFRAFPDDWSVMLPRQLGPPKVLATSKSKFTEEELEATLRGEKAEAAAGGDWMGNVLNSVGGLFQPK